MFELFVTFMCYTYDGMYKELRKNMCKILFLCVVIVQENDIHKLNTKVFLLQYLQFTGNLVVHT